MFFASSGKQYPVAYLSNKLKELSETNGDETDEYLNDFDILSQDPSVDHTSKKYKQKSLLDSLEKEISPPELLEIELSKDENFLYEEKKNMTVKQIKEVLVGDLLKSSYHTLSIDFRDFVDSLDMKDEQIFELFEQKKAESYFPDDEFVYNLCYGLVSLEELEEEKEKEKEKEKE